MPECDLVFIIDQTFMFYRMTLTSISTLALFKVSEAKQVWEILPQLFYIQEGPK